VRKFYTSDIHEQKKKDVCRRFSSQIIVRTKIEIPVLPVLHVVVCQLCSHTSSDYKAKDL